VTPGGRDNAAAWAQWHEAAADTRIDRALRTLYADIDAAIAKRGPTCWQSGKCCDFGSYGHRLYVTALEVAWFRQQAVRSGEPRDAGEASSLTLTQFADGPRCPYQHDRTCTTHAIRPLGCRVFFCQAGTQTWQQELYEAYLSKLRALHDRQGIAYRYADWLALLAEADAAVDAQAAVTPAASPAAAAPIRR
jgi:Fe-S-cluster containining protein